MLGRAIRLFTSFTKIIIVVLIITFAPGLPPDLDFESYTLTPPSFEGALKINKKLDNAEHLFENELKGPEDFAIFNNELYTSCHGGFIYRISKGKLETVLKTGKDCLGIFQEHICGRPLGIKFDKSGLLYLADSYYGLMKSNLTTGALEILVPMSEEIDGQQPMIPNSLVISQDNKFIYWTDSSTTHYLYDGIFILLGNGRGRVLKYIISEKKNEVLLKNLHFPNGIALSNDGTFLIIAETFRARLLRFYLKGSKTGTSDVFVDNLPGFPDNVHIFGKDNFIVSLVLIDNMIIKLAETPHVRQFIARLLALIQSVFSVANFFYSNHMFEKAIHWIGHFEMLKLLEPYLSKHTISVIIDNNGKIIDSYHSTDGNVVSISSLMKYKNHLYLGSPFNSYVGRVKE